MPWKTDSKEVQRWELVRTILAGQKTIAQLCREVGVTRQTAYKFLRRFESEGRRGLRDRSCRNKQPGLRHRWGRRIVALRRHWPTWGGEKLRVRLALLHPDERVPQVRTIERWLKAAGLSRRKTRKRAGVGLKQLQYKAKRCDDVWTVDHKGWFCAKGGKKLEPLTVRDLASRYLLAACAVGKTEAVTRQVFGRLFRRHGLPRAIRCDRGTPFCGSGPYGFTRLSLWWHRLGVQVDFVKRSRGVHNNEHEQMHRVLQAEVVEGPPASYAQMLRRLKRWQKIYNEMRPHRALDLCTPASRYKSARRPIPKLQSPRYPANWTVRKVKNKGEVLLHGYTCGIGRAFAGLPIGFRHIHQTRFKVYFGRLPLGTVDLTTQPNLRP